jgi:hypothetical protein
MAQDQLGVGRKTAGGLEECFPSGKRMGRDRRPHQGGEEDRGRVGKPDATGAADEEAGIGEVAVADDGAGQGITAEHEEQQHRLTTADRQTEWRPAD